MAHMILLLLTATILFHSYGFVQECDYEALEKSLLERKGNKYELSRAFFPPIENPPEFIAVKYNFTESSESQSWYWSISSSSFIHPPEVLQFLSLFFAKPHVYYSGEVKINLDNNSVAGCAQDLLKMQLLTQRLQIYAAMQTSPAKVDITYTAKAYLVSELNHYPNYDDVTFERESSKCNRTGAVVILCEGIVSLFSWIIITCIVFGVVHSNNKHWDKQIAKQIPLTFSLAVISPLVCVYNFILSICSLHYWLIQYLSTQLYMFCNHRNYAPVLLVFFFDFCILMYCFSVLVASFLLYHDSYIKEMCTGLCACCKKKKGQGSVRDQPQQPTVNLGEQQQPEGEGSNGGAQVERERGQQPQPGEDGNGGAQVEGEGGQHPQPGEGGNGGAQVEGEGGQHPQPGEGGNGGAQVEGEGGQHPQPGEGGNGGAQVEGEGGQHPQPGEGGNGGAQVEGEGGQHPQPGEGGNGGTQVEGEGGQHLQPDGEGGNGGAQVEGEGGQHPQPGEGGNGGAQVEGEGGQHPQPEGGGGTQHHPVEAEEGGMQQAQGRDSGNQQPEREDSDTNQQQKSGNGEGDQNIEAGNTPKRPRISWYLLLSLVVLGPIFSIIAHSPYIAIAYLNDGYHAGSIFIYYTIILCLSYSICWMGYHTVKVRFNSLQPSCTKTNHITVGCGLAVFIFLVAVITVYFVIIPINKSISDAPNRLV